MSHIEYTVKVFNDGTRYWYKDGKLHREDGPAVESNDGTKRWYKDGKIHREDGPAIEIASGPKYWYLNDKCFTKASFDIRIAKLTKEKEKSASCDGKIVEIEGKKYVLHLKNDEK